MTLFGKILIGLILTLSLVFASLSAAVYSAQFDYRAALDTAKTDLATARADREDLEKQLRARIGDLEAAVAEQEELKNLAVGKSDDLAEAVRLSEEELNATRTALDTQTALAQIAKQEADARRQEVLAGRQRNAALFDRNVAAETQIGGLTDNVFSLELSTEQMAARNAQLMDELAVALKQLRDAGIEPIRDGRAPDEPAPSVEGRVLAVKDSGSAGTLASISLGSDDGLRLRDELFVYRLDDSKYVGRVAIVRVNPDTAVVSLIPGTLSDTTSIQKGDNVSTRL